MKLCKILAVAVVMTTVGAGWARAEILNSFEPAPTLTGGATTFTMVLQGNVISDLNLSETQNDTLLNPFQYVNQNIVGSGTTSVTAALDGNGNTVVTFTGSNPILSSYTFDYGNGLPHIGLDGSEGASINGGGPTLNILSQSWSNSTSTMTLPSISVSTVNGVIADPYAVFFAEVTANGNTVGEWFELPYTGTAPKLTITNYTGSVETLSDVGFFLSPTLIPLDDLNYGSTPPPGTPGSPFIPLPSLDGTSLAAGNGTGGAGGSVTTQSLPEPSSIISLATGLLVVAGWFGRSRIASRPGRTGASA